METKAKNKSYLDEIKKLGDKSAKIGSKQIRMRTVFKLGALGTLGAGVGVLAGISGSIAAAAVLESVIPSILITKTAGIVGGAAGVLAGIGDIPKHDVKEMA
ncbi:MAG: hypothetical protein ISR65_02145 [Bacteriovoracaceae bacterium]|nr:hypothetical protein [Bacteriovoracaceae bacterium]